MKDLTQGKPFKSILLFGLPLLISGIIAQTYNLIDLLIAGRYLGSVGLSAVGSTSTFISFLSSYFWGFGVAVSTVIGKYFGAKDNERVVKAAKNILFFVSLTMVVVCALCFLLADPIFRLLNIQSDIYEDAMVYFRIYIFSLFAQAVAYQLTSVLHAIGDSKIPLLATTVSGIANVGLNLLFVGVFDWKVAGLAYATLASSIAGALISLIAVIRYIFKMGYNLKWQFSWDSIQPIITIAIPCVIQQCALYLSGVAVQPMVNGISKEAVAGYSVAMSINTFINAAYHSYSRAVASYASQSLGSKKYNNFNKGVLIGFSQQAMIFLPMMAVCLIFPVPIISLFLKNNSTDCIPYALNYMWFALPFVPFCAYGNLMHSFYKAVGAVKSVLVSTTVFTLARIAFTYLVPPGDNLMTIYLGLSFAWIVETIVLLVIYFSRIWQPSEMKATKIENKGN